MATPDAYDEVLKVLGEMAEQGRVQADKVSDTLRIQREVVNRAINYLNHEVLALSKRFDDDDAARAKRQAQIDTEMKVRQQQVDAKMEAIIIGQEQIKRWQAIRLGIELAAILIVIAFVIGASR